MNGQNWITVEPLGQLHYEQILVTFEIPELFVCADAKQRRYLAVLLDEDCDAYLLVRTTPDILLQMLGEKITMEQAFRSAPDATAYYIDFHADEKSYSLIRKPIQDVLPEDLPDVGIFFTLHNPSLDRYREALSLHQTEMKQMPAARPVKTKKITNSMTLSYAFGCWRDHFATSERYLRVSCNLDANYQVFRGEEYETKLLSVCESYPNKITVSA